jgi:hypothetical protein
MGALCLLPLFTRMNVWVSGAVAFGMFVVASKNVYEHYILWSIPFLIIVTFVQRSTMALICLGLGMTSMALRTEVKQFLDSDINLNWTLMLAITFLVMCISLVVQQGNFREALVFQWLQRLKDRAKAPEPTPEPETASENG